MQHKLLVIDDDQDMAELISIIGRKQLPNVQIFVAKDGAQGLQIAFAEKPGVVVLDIKLPDIGGFAVCRQLRAAAATANTHILMITGVLMDAKDRIRGIESGADGYLFKPFDPAELVLQLKALFRWWEKEQTQVEELEGMVVERTQALSDSNIRLQREVLDRRRAEADLRTSHSLQLATLEATADGILAVDAQGRVTSYNQRFLDLWQIPEPLMASRDDERLLQYVRDQLVEPTAFLAKVHELYHNPAASSWDELKFRDGRIFERCSQPQRVGDEIVGRVWSFRDVTKRKRAEEKLQESRDQYERAANTVPVMLFDAVLLPNGGSQFVYVAPQPCRDLLEVNPFSLLADMHLFWRMVDPRDSERLKEEKNAALRAGTAFTSEVRLNTPAGRAKWILLTAKPAPTKPGEPVVWSGFIQDITAVKQAEAALKAECDRAEQYLKIAEVILVALDDQARVTLINRKGLDVLGYQEGELLGQDWFRVCLPGDEYETALATYQKLMAGERKPDEYFENHILTKTGARRYIAWHNTQVKDASGRITGTLSSGEDITNRKLAEAENRQLAMVVEQSAEAIVITDTRGTILYVNPAFERTSGYSRQEVVGQNPRLLKSGKQDATFYKRLWAMLTRGETWQGRFCNRRKDGTLYEERATLSPIRNADGVITHYVAIKLDVTHEQQLEAQLQQAQKMDLVGRLAGGVAHDFNNILQAILGYTEALLDEMPASDQRRADLLEIQKSAHRAASLTDQLLAFSRKQAVALAPLHINKVVNDTQKMVQRLIGEDIRIETNLAPNLPQVRADAGQFQQVLMNLAIHAREAMPHGGRLSIRTDIVVFDEQDMSVMADARPGCFIYLAVTDTGVGMSREELAHVFEPFYNLPDSGKGTGLGLSVVYGIAQQHQGWIHVYSQQGKGTTFKLYLPACPTELGGTDLLPVAPATPPAGRGERILLVEDELAIRQWATRVLRGAGYEVLTADNAAGALTLFRQEEGRFDLLFSDIVLPDQSGLEIAEQLRQQQPGLPVLLCSGYTDEHDRWSAIEQQRYHFLQKPYPCAQLLRRVRAILDTASA